MSETINCGECGSEMQYGNCFDCKDKAITQAKLEGKQEVFRDFDNWFQVRHTITESRYNKIRRFHLEEKNLKKGEMSKCKFSLFSLSTLDKSLCVLTVTSWDNGIECDGIKGKNDCPLWK